MTMVKNSVVDSFSDLTDADFEYFKHTIFGLAGISLSSAKRELVKSRLRSHIQSLGMQSYTEYRKFLSTLSKGDQEWQRFINFFTTNKTDFFRESQHFDYLRKTFIPGWQKRNKGNFRIWCCASSSGQEPYTLAMVIDRALSKTMNYKILATDIDTEILQKAKNGVYPITKLSEIPNEYHQEFVGVGKKDVSGWFRISNRIRERIVFAQHNLIENTYPGDDLFDGIFCRNVLIYFSEETIKTLMLKLHRSLKKDGLLFIGHSESISKCSHIFKMIKPSIYQKISIDV